MANSIPIRQFFVVAVLVVSGGCSGNDPQQELTPAPHPQLRQVEPEQLISQRQEISGVGYSTYLNFAGIERSNYLAVDGAGNAYVSGATSSFGNVNSIDNIYVAKLSPSGSLLYVTYFPGFTPRGLTVDASGSVYVLNGSTYLGGSGPKLTKIDPTGTAVVYSANLGWDDVFSVQVDSSGNAYVAGSVNTGARGTDVAVGKVNPSGSAFVYSVTFGGTGTDGASDIAIDSAGNAYVTGGTDSLNFPLSNPYQSTMRGWKDVFVAKLNAAGTALLYSTYLGGVGYENGNAIAVDSAGNAYVAGYAAPLNGAQSFPITSGVVQGSPGVSEDGFAAKFGPTGNLLYSTYIAGNSFDYATDIAVGSTGTVYVSGYTASTNLLTTSNAFQRFSPGPYDNFLVQLSPTFSSYTYATYLGGSSNDYGGKVGLDAFNHVYVAGDSLSANYPTTVYGPGGKGDAVVTKFNGP